MFSLLHTCRPVVEFDGHRLFGVAVRSQPQSGPSRQGPQLSLNDVRPCMSLDPPPRLARSTAASGVEGPGARSGPRMAQSVDDRGRGARLARRDEGAYMLGM